MAHKSTFYHFNGRNDQLIVSRMTCSEAHSHKLVWHNNSVDAMRRVKTIDQGVKSLDTVSDNVQSIFSRAKSLIPWL